MNYPSVFYLGDPEVRAHFKRSGDYWIESIMLINKYGFEKKETIDANEKYFRFR